MTVERESEIMSFFNGCAWVESLPSELWSVHKDRGEKCSDTVESGWSIDIDADGRDRQSTLKSQMSAWDFWELFKRFGAIWDRKHFEYFVFFTPTLIAIEIKERKIRLQSVNVQWFRCSLMFRLLRHKLLFRARHFYLLERRKPANWNGPMFAV